MADYRFLTDQEKNEIVTELAAAQPKPEDVEREAERAHFRRVTAAKIRGDADGAAEIYSPPTQAIENATNATAEVAAVASNVGVILADPKALIA